MTSDCNRLGLYLRGLSHVPSSCLAEEIQLLVERLGSMFSCVIKLLGGIGRCRKDM